jgi:hypothetical protein
LAPRCWRLLVSVAGAEMRMRDTFVMNESLVALMELLVVNSEVLSEKSLMLSTNFRESRPLGRWILVL